MPIWRAPSRHHARRPLAHECLDLVDLAWREADALQLVAGDEVVVLYADAGVLVAAHRREHLGDERPIFWGVRQCIKGRCADVDARLDREGVTLLEEMI